jgi:hypothetical protein
VTGWVWRISSANSSAYYNGRIMVLLLANWANTIDTAGVAGAWRSFTCPGIGASSSPWRAVPRGYWPIERISRGRRLHLVCVSAVLAKPEWGTVLRAAVVPSLRLDSGYIVLLIALIGTTIAPWMQFYQQAAVVDKGLTVDDLRLERWDVVLGALITALVAGSIIVATAATLFPHGIQVERAEDAARALAPLAGTYASLLFALGLLNAAVFSVAIIPLSTARDLWPLGGGRARPHRRGGAGLHGLFLVLVTSALVVLSGRASAGAGDGGVSSLNGILPPAVLVIMLRLVNDRRLMGRKVNSSGANARRVGHHFSNPHSPDAGLAREEPVGSDGTVQDRRHRPAAPVLR